jgi:hypothetical protein
VDYAVLNLVIVEVQLTIVEMELELHKYKETVKQKDVQEDTVVQNMVFVEIHLHIVILQDQTMEVVKLKVVLQDNVVVLMDSKCKNTIKILIVG